MALTELTKVTGPGIHTLSNVLSHNIKSSGIITATKFSGPLDSIGGNFAGVITATNGVFSGNISAVDGNFSGNVTIGGTLTYEDVTNIDSVGIITARDGLKVLGGGANIVGVVTATGADINGDLDVDGHTNLDNGNVAGIVTFNTGSALHTDGGQILLKDRPDGNNNNLFFGTGGKAVAYHDGTNFSIVNNTGHSYIGVGAASKDLYLYAQTSGNVVLQQNTGVRYVKGVGSDASVQLFFNNNLRLNTTTAGVSIPKDLDVDGHTNLDNVSIAGVTTMGQTTIFTTGGTTLLLKDSDSSNPADRSGIAFVDQNSTQTAFIGKESASDAVLTINNTNTINPIRLKVNNTTRLEVGNAGVYATGSLNATGTLSAGGTLYIPDDIQHIGDTNTKIRFPAADTISFETGGSERLRIDSSGKVGINNTSPTSQLDGANDLVIGDTSDADSGITLVSTTSGQGLIHFSDATSGNARYDGFIGYEQTGRFLKFGTAQAERLRINSDGDVLISHTTTPSADIKLLVGGNAGVTDGKYFSFRASYGNTSEPAAHAIKFDSTIGAGGGLHYYGYSGMHFDLGGQPRIQFTQTGNILPNTSGALDIGSASAEIGDVYLANSKKVYFGSTQTLSIHNDGSNSLITDSSSAMFVRSNRILFQNSGGTEGYGEFNQNGSVYWTHDNIKRIETTATGIEVTGEVAASQDYPNIRPVLDFNFAATKKLKPEMTFAREGEASFHDGVGSVKFVSDNEPRFEHDIVTGECKGIMFEGAGTNYSHYSRRFDVVATGSWIKVGSASITANTYTAPDGTSSGIYMADTISGATGTTFNGNVLRQQITAGANVKHTLSIYIKLITSTQATIYIRDGATGSTSTANAISNTRNWQRVVVTSSAALTNATAHSFYVGNTNGDIAVWGAQIERSDYVTSYIKTDTNSNGTRNTDKGVHLDGEDVTNIFNQGQGTLIAEAILTQSVGNNPIVGFYQDFGSHNRLELRGDASSVGGARFEAVVGGSTVTSLTTGLTHSGVNNVSKYAYTFQENNYAGCVNGGSVTTDSSSTFPHGTGIDSMMIGEAVYSVDAAVIVKRIMYYADRLPNSQLVTLTS